jgi:hypothetical protein
MKRSPQVDISVRKRARQIQESSVPMLMALPCCHLKCLHELSAMQVEHVRSYYANLPDEKSRRFLLWTAVKHGKSNREVARFKQVEQAHLIIPELRFDRFLCASALRVVTGGGSTRIRSYMSYRTSGISDKDILTSLPRRSNCPNKRRLHMLGFLKFKISTLADIDPTDGTRHMPMNFSLKSLYAEYCDDPDMKNYFSSQDLGEPLTYQTLCRIWDEDFSDVKIPRHTRLGKCDTCFNLNAEMAKQDPGSEAQKRYKTLLSEHHQLVANERVLYHEARKASQCPAAETLSVIFDGARPIGFPNLIPTPKMFSDLSRLQLPLYGIICHTYSINQLITSPPHLTHDVNFLLTALANMLGSLYLQHGSKFPRKHLLMQADNTTAQNKNYFVIAFAGLLVHNGLFEDVELNFLPCGHTHVSILGF